MSEREEKQSKQKLQLTQEEKDNLVGFFALLIKVDKRINPELYKIKTNKKYD